MRKDVLSLHAFLVIALLFSIASLLFGNKQTMAAQSAATATEYSILSAYSAKDLSKQVNSLIRAGWQPLGGVSGSGNVDGAGTPGFSQAMTK